MSGSICKHYFARLAAGVWRLWKEYQYDEAAFSDVALQMLTEEPPAEQVSFLDAARRRRWSMLPSFLSHCNL